MSKQVSSKTSSIENECITSLSMEVLPSSTQLNQHYPQWKPLQRIEHLDLNETVVYDDRLSKVSFICSDYVVITPKDMQYGICVFSQFINRISKLYETDSQSTSGN